MREGDSKKYKGNYSWNCNTDKLYYQQKYRIHAGTLRFD